MVDHLLILIEKCSKYFKFDFGSNCAIFILSRLFKPTHEFSPFELSLSSVLVICPLPGSNAEEVRF